MTYKITIQNKEIVFLEVLIFEISHLIAANERHITTDTQQHTYTRIYFIPVFETQGNDLRSD